MNEALANEPKRARRRRDLARMKAKARRVYPEAPKATHWADYLAVCSCYICNPHRRFHGPTMQERRAFAALRVTRDLRP